MQLNKMQKAVILNHADDYTRTIIVQPLVDTHHTTYLDDERLSKTTTMISHHLEGISHAYVITTPTFSPATYGLILLTSRQLRWTANIPDEYIHAKFQPSPARTSTNPITPRTPAP